MRVFRIGKVSLLPKERRHMSTKAPNPVDKYVGSRMRMRRIMLGMSQEKLGEALGLTFQQIQKYEKGTNRVGASRIQQISEALQVPVSFLFEGGPSSVAKVFPKTLRRPTSPIFSRPRRDWPLHARSRASQTQK